mmetsp:Transcript_34170/g.41232  ORF Transcript_34170/g.41232 Transcript_34170/m.41232 type:complete len:161 (+) Transcript_34170:132-614(+)
MKMLCVSRTSVAYVPNTTIELSGKRKIFRIAPCSESGMYFERRVPATGMNSPTQNSHNTKHISTVSKQLAPADPKHREGTAILTAARVYTINADVSASLPSRVNFDTIFCKGGNNAPPIVIAIIKAEKTAPVGKPSGGSSESNVGTHIKTNVYIAPSLKD